MNDGCVFCRLVSERHIHVYENDLTYAIRDIHPAVPGHTLVINKRHVATVFELTSDEVLALAETLTIVRDDLSRLYSTSSFNVLANCGADAGQSVFHAHVHVLPRAQKTEAPRRQQLAGLMGVDQA